MSTSSTPRRRATGESAGEAAGRGDRASRAVGTRHSSRNSSGTTRALAEPKLTSVSPLSFSG